MDDNVKRTPKKKGKRERKKKKENGDSSRSCNGGGRKEKKKDKKMDKNCEVVSTEETNIHAGEKMERKTFELAGETETPRRNKSTSSTRVPAELRTGEGGDRESRSYKVWPREFHIPLLQRRFPTKPDGNSATRTRILNSKVYPLKWLVRCDLCSRS